MSLGIILLILTGLVIYFGAAQRVLDKLYLTDSMALFFLALIIAGSFFDVTVIRTPLVTVNAGGALVPVVLAVYVLTRAGTGKEWIRTIIAVILTGGAIYAISLIFHDFGHGYDLIDPTFVFAISGGIIAYILGGSRRGSFIAGTLGFLIYDLIILWQVLTGQIVAEVRIGGAGIFDSIIISGLIAVLLAEFIGESLERIKGGHHERGKGGENGDEK